MVFRLQITLFQVVVKLGFYERKLQVIETEKYEEWLNSRPAERLLEIGKEVLLKLCYSLLDSKSCVERIIQSQIYLISTTQHAFQGSKGFLVTSIGTIWELQYSELYVRAVNNVILLKLSNTTRLSSYGFETSSTRI